MKNAEFVVLNQYADWEGAYLSSQLNQRKDWTVRTASITPTVTSIGGFTTKVDDLITQVPKHIDLLILIGGNSWDIENEGLYTLISKCLESSIPVGAICGAVDFLAKTGLLTGFKHTGNAQYLWQPFEKYTNIDDFQSVQMIQDRNLITANGTATLDFTAQVLKTIGVSDQEIRMAVELHRLGFYKYTAKYGNPYQQ